MFVGCEVGVGGIGVGVGGEVGVGETVVFVGGEVGVNGADGIVCDGVGVNEDVGAMLTIEVDVGDRSGELVLVGSEATVVGKSVSNIGGSSFTGWIGMMMKGSSSRFPTSGFMKTVGLCRLSFLISSMIAGSTGGMTMAVHSP